MGHIVLVISEAGGNILLTFTSQRYFLPILNLVNKKTILFDIVNRKRLILKSNKNNFTHCRNNIFYQFLNL